MISTDPDNKHDDTYAYDAAEKDDLLRCVS